MTDKTTSAIDLVERLRNYAPVASMLGHKLDDPNNVVVLATEAADTITRLQAALAEIREAVSRRQLPITNQVYEIADSALKSVGGG